MQDTLISEPQVNNYYTKSDFGNLISELPFSDLNSSFVKKATTRVGLDKDDVGVFKHDDNLYFCINNAIYKFDNSQPLLQQLDSIETDSEDHKFRTYVFLISKIIRGVRGGKETDNDNLAPSEIVDSDLHHLNMGLYSKVVKGAFILADDLMLFDENNTLYSLKSANQFLHKQFEVDKTRDYFNRIFETGFAINNEIDHVGIIKWKDAETLNRLASKNKIYQLDKSCKFLTSLIDASTQIQQEEEKPSCFSCSQKKPQLTFKFADGTDRKLNLKDFFKKNLKEDEYELYKADIRKLKYFDFESTPNTYIDSLGIKNDAIREVLKKLQRKLLQQSSPTEASQDPKTTYFAPKIIVGESRSVSFTNEHSPPDNFSGIFFSDSFPLNSSEQNSYQCLPQHELLAPPLPLPQQEDFVEKESIDIQDSGQVRFLSPVPNPDQPQYIAPVPIPAPKATPPSSSDSISSSLYPQALHENHYFFDPTKSLITGPSNASPTSNNFDTQGHSFDLTQPLTKPKHKAGYYDAPYVATSAGYYDAPYVATSAGYYGTPYAAPSAAPYAAPSAGPSAGYYAAPSAAPYAAPSVVPSNASSEFDILIHIIQGFNTLSSVFLNGWSANATETQEPSPPPQNNQNPLDKPPSILKPSNQKGNNPTSLEQRFRSTQDAGNETQTDNNGRGAMTKNYLWV